MQATLNLHLGDVLDAEDLRQLAAVVAEERRPLEKVLFEAAKEIASRKKHGLSAIEPATTEAA